MAEIYLAAANRLFKQTEPAFTNYLGVGMWTAILIACAIAAPFVMYVFRVFKGG